MVPTVSNARPVLIEQGKITDYGRGLVTSGTVSLLLGTTAEHVRSYAKSGALRSVRVGNRHMFNPLDRKWIAVPKDLFVLAS